VAAHSLQAAEGLPWGVIYPPYVKDWNMATNIAYVVGSCVIIAVFLAYYFFS
jgi:hypothetical protein